MCHFAFSWTYLNNFNIQALHYLLSVVPFSRLDDTQGVTIHHETGKRGGEAPNCCGDVYNRYAAPTDPTVGFLYWFYIISTSIYYMYIYIFLKIYILGKKYMQCVFFSDFFTFMRKNTAKRLVSEPEQARNSGVAS